MEKPSIGRKDTQGKYPKIITTTKSLYIHKKKNKNIFSTKQKTISFSGTHLFYKFNKIYFHIKK